MGDKLCKLKSELKRAEKLRVALEAQSNKLKYPAAKKLVDEQTAIVAKLKSRITQAEDFLISRCHF